MKKQFFVMLTALLCNACATMMLNDADQKYSDNWESNETLNDTIVSLARPVQKLEGLNNPLILIGEKQQYLLQAANDSNITAELLQHADLSHLFIHPLDNTYHPTSQLSVFTGTRKLCGTSEQGCMTVRFVLHKPQSQFKKGEQQKLEQLGFECQKAEQITNCVLDKVQFTVQPLQNSQRAPHIYTFRESLPIAFFSFHKGSPDHPLKLLKPLAFTFDVIALPITLTTIGISCSVLKCKFGGFR